MPRELVSSTQTPLFLLSTPSHSSKQVLPYVFPLTPQTNLTLGEQSQASDVAVEGSLRS